MGDPTGVPFDALSFAQDRQEGLNWGNIPVSVKAIRAEFNRDEGDKGDVEGMISMKAAR